MEKVTIVEEHERHISETPGFSMIRHNTVALELGVEFRHIIFQDKELLELVALTEDGVRDWQRKAATQGRTKPL